METNPDELPVATPDELPVATPVGKKTLIFFKSPRQFTGPQYTYHENVFAVLCVEKDGFTITNARKSISSLDFSTLGEVVYRMRLKKLFLFDEFSRDMWVERKNYQQKMLQEKILEKMDITKCRYCRRIDCHRWKATACGMGQLLQFTLIPFILHPVQITTQVTRHLSRVAISITKKGFTISDGILSVSFDGLHSNAFISRVIGKFKVRVVLAVDFYTMTRCEAIGESVHFSQIHFKRLEPFAAGRCDYCSEENCHRWLATVGGIARINKFLIDPIRH